MRKNIGKLCGALFVLLILVSETSYALGTITKNTFTMMTDNHNPNPPEITGPPSGNSRKIYNYNFLLTDPDGDSLDSILIEWGGTDVDNTTYICWTCGGSPKPNGTIFIASHSWSTPGTYTIRAKVWDLQHNESDWGTLTVTMPSSYNIPSLWERLLERLPHSLPILRHLLGY